MRATGILLALGLALTGRPAGGAQTDTADSVTAPDVVQVQDVDEPGRVTVVPATPRVDGSRRPPREGEKLVAKLSDPDGGVSDCRWKWERERWPGDWQAAHIESKASSRYTPRAEDVGHPLRVRVSYLDAGSRDGNDRKTVTSGLGVPEGMGKARRVARKLLWGVLGGAVIATPGGVIGTVIDTGCDRSDRELDGDVCVELRGLFVGMGAGWILGIPMGVSMEESNDRLIHVLGGSLGGLAIGGYLTLIDEALWPSMIACPVVFSAMASELSRRAQLSRKILGTPGEGRRFSIGLAPGAAGDLAARATFRF